MDLQLLDEGLDAVEKEMQVVIDSDVSVLYDASEHILSSGGKRIRPRMALLAYLAAGGEDVQSVVALATAVEMVHTATLVHDDINDHSLIRRGKPTVDSIWGRTFALLTGDYLFTKVYQLMAPYGAAYNIIMADACSKLVEGETLQAAAAKAGEMDQETYKQIISRKTASLFEAGASMGAMKAGATAELVAALGTYAYNLGLTFQIIDDILDIVGDPEKMGKPVGSDIVQGRGVVVAQNGHLGMEATATAVAENDPIEQMLADLRDSGAIQIARFQAQRTAQRAREALAKVPASPYRTEMEELIELVLERDN